MINLKRITPLLLTFPLVVSPLYGIKHVKKQIKKVKIEKAIETIKEDSLFIYSPGDKNGAHVTLINNGKATEIGQIFSSDYSRWGSEKRMNNLFVKSLPTGGYAAVFSVNDYAPCFAVAYSEDLITWRPQDYPRMSVKGCLSPVFKYIGNDTYAILFKTKDGQVRKTTTGKDFRHFTPDYAASIDEYEEIAQQTKQVVGGREFLGNIETVLPAKVNDIKDYFSQLGIERSLNSEKLSDDGKRFANLGKEVEASLTINGQERKTISDKLIGIFFEDISYAADGGLYAEMVQNRDFEYNAADHHGWTASTAWHTSSPDGKLTIQTDEPLSVNNPHYAILSSDTLSNEGWDGMVLQKGKKYDFTFCVKLIDVKSKNFTVALMNGNEVLASERIKVKAQKTGPVWNTYNIVLTASADCNKARLVIVPQKKGHVGVDMISLFPQDTFKGRKNGLRKDLAQTLADLHPKFVRFPGGCMSHGDGLDNIYHWWHSVGPLEDRVYDRNIWNYHQTRGLGFFEYFQFCEDIGAEPLPVLAAGVPCQNSGPDKDGFGGQQGGIPMKDMPDYIQELLNLIEWANGDPATNKWAKMRAEAGHPAPFNLKYIGIGNEDIISTDFEDRCLMIADAIKKHYPNITICGTVGPFHAPSSDYVEGWKFAKQHKDVLDMVDEHYYESVGWFLNHQHYYDQYDRNAPKVYLGEYAARQGKGGLDCALAEAAYLCHIERNADIVSMTSYAPLLSKNGHSNWSPDMIYFSNTSIQRTPSYETQRLFSVYSGNEYITSNLTVDSTLQNRIAASVVRDSNTGQTYLKVVNILPSTLRLTLSLKDIQLSGNNILLEGFYGKPGSQKVETIQNKLVVPTDSKLTLTLKPYSFQVIKL